ncbi:MAG: hypothetical protein FWE22_05630 [Firmicutes bacterium]|nr:hypothetical protein [Bacillota bacterium]
MKKWVIPVVLLTAGIIICLLTYFVILNFDYMRARIRGYELFSPYYLELIHEQGKQSGEYEARQESGRQEEYYRNIIDELERESENQLEPCTEEADELERELDELDNETIVLRLEYYNARLELLTARYSIVFAEISSLQSQLNAINVEYDGLRNNLQMSIVNLQRLMALSVKRIELLMSYSIYSAELVDLNAEIEQIKLQIEEATI